jgi:hypothetical protein
MEKRFQVRLDTKRQYIEKFNLAFQGFFRHLTLQRRLEFPVLVLAF